jgi:hypothetical protein
MPRGVPVHLVVLLLLGLVGSAVSPSASTAAASAPLRAGGRIIDCHYLHAGREVGDGESTEGTILSATLLSCRHALRIVRPRYKEVLRIEAESGTPTGSFRLGGFGCGWRRQGPDTLKSCADGRRRFTFL